MNLRRAALWAAALAALAGVFALYRDPNLIVELGQRINACF